MNKQEKVKKILELRFVKNFTLQKIGNIFGVSRQRIDQLLKNRKNIEPNERFNILFSYDFKCQWCGIILTNKTYQIHHIDLNPSNNKNNNLICLCKKCHKKFHLLNREKTKI